jgi:hypothetical protein
VRYGQNPPEAGCAWDKIDACPFFSWVRRFCQEGETGLVLLVVCRVLYCRCLALAYPVDGELFPLLFVIIDDICQGFDV